MPALVKVITVYAVLLTLVFIVAVVASVAQGHYEPLVAIAIFAVIGTPIWLAVRADKRSEGRS